MKRLVRIIFSFAGALLALLAAGNFNLFALMKFIPRSSSYDVCITVYFTVFDAIMNWLFDYICGRIDRRKTVVKVELESKERDRNGVPQILLTQEMAEFKVRVHISGKRKNIQGSEIRFKALKQASYTVGKRGAGIHQDGNGDIFIRIDELINETNNDSDITEEYIIDMQLNDIDYTGTVKIEPEKIKQHMFLSYDSDYAVVNFGRSI